MPSHRDRARAAARPYADPRAGTRSSPTARPTYRPAAKPSWPRAKKTRYIEARGLAGERGTQSIPHYFTSTVGSNPLRRGQHQRPQVSLSRRSCSSVRLIECSEPDECPNTSTQRYGACRLDPRLNSEHRRPVTSPHGSAQRNHPNQIPVLNYQQLGRRQTPRPFRNRMTRPQVSRTRPPADRGGPLALSGPRLRRSQIVSGRSHSDRFQRSKIRRCAPSAVDRSTPPDLRSL